MEIATRKVWVWASDEILNELKRGWSRPVQVHAEQNTDGSWEMTFRTSEKLERLSQALMDADKST